MTTTDPGGRGASILTSPRDALHLDERPDGPGAAAMMAAGIGIFVLGLFTLLSEASVPIHDWLESLEFGRGVDRSRARRSSAPLVSSRRGSSSGSRGGPRSSTFDGGSGSRSPLGSSARC